MNLLLALLMAASFGASGWRSADWDGRGGTCSVEQHGSVTVHICKSQGKVVQVDCRDREGNPTACPRDVQELIWRSK